MTNENEVSDAVDSGVTTSEGGKSKGKEEVPAVVADNLQVEEEAAPASTNASDELTSSASNSAKTSQPSYPKALYCPITGDLLEEPVVAPDGFTYSRAALKNRGDDMSKIYDNRSIKTIMDEVVEHPTTSKLKRLGRNVRQLSQTLIALTDYQQRPLPEGFYCPITLGLIHTPVIDPEGYSYEKVAIENWIRCNGASPVTRRALAMEDLYPNKTLSALMAEEKAKSDDLVHPIFKQWDEEQASNIPDIEISQSVRSTLFPSTPEELEAANRRRRVRRFNLIIVWFLVVAVLGVLAYMVPVVSTVLLVLILFCVAVVAGYSSNSQPFRDRDSSRHGSRRSVGPTPSSTT